MTASANSRTRSAMLVAGIFLAGLGLGAASALAAEPAAAAQAPRPQTIFLRVQVGADGQVKSSESLDAKVAPVLLQTAQQAVSKVHFEPATKDGRAVASETTLVLTLGFEPEGGGFAVALKRAHSGPHVLKVGTFQQPKVNGRENGGLITVSANLRADGTVDMATYRVDKAELRVPATFAQEQFEKSARFAMNGARFQLDKVDGSEIPSRVSVPFSFNGGAAKLERGEEGDEDEGEGKHGDKRPPMPLISATSNVEGVVLPKLDYTAPQK